MSQNQQQQSETQTGQSDRADLSDDEARGDAADYENGRVDEPSADEPARDEDPEAEADTRADGGPDSEAEVARLKEAMLRMRAEMDNREKRLEREMTKTRKFALESLMRDLVPVLDSLDQALAAVDPGNEGSAREGLEVTRRQALNVLTSHGLEVLDPVGEAFDPTWHEAMSTQPTAEHDPDTIVQVLQKGYRLNERLIRPARVIVAKAPEG